MSSPKKSPTMDFPPSSVEQTHPLPKPSSSLEIVATTYQPIQHNEVANNNGTSSLSPLSLLAEEIDEEEALNNFINNEKNKQDASYLKSFPAGFRFQPRDDELVKFYLYNKVMGHQLPPNNIMAVNIYLNNPEDLALTFESYGEKQWYFFTPRKRKYRNGKRPNRRAGEGYWKATGADKPITSDGVVIGFKKALVYYKGKPPKGEKTNWIMHEFRLLDSTTTKRTPDDMRLDTWVLCRIYEKADKRILHTINHEAELVDEDMYAIDTEMEMNAQIDNCQSTKHEEENTYTIDHPPLEHERGDLNPTYGYTSYIGEQPIVDTSLNNNKIIGEYDPYFQPNDLSPSFSALESLDYQNYTSTINLDDIISEFGDYKNEASYQNWGDAVDHNKNIMGEALPSSDGLQYTTKEEANDIYDGLSACFK